MYCQTELLISLIVIYIKSEACLSISVEHFFVVQGQKYSETFMFLVSKVL